MKQNFWLAKAWRLIHSGYLPLIFKFANNPVFIDYTGDQWTILAVIPVHGFTQD